VEKVGHAVFLTASAALIGVFCVAAGARADAPPILLGAVMTLSGEGAEQDADLAYGYLTAIEALNDAGGVLVGDVRRPLALEIMDDRGSERRAAALADVLVRRRDVTLFLASSNLPMVRAIAEEVAVYGFPVIDPTGYRASGTTPGNVFSVVPAIEDRAAAALAGLVVAYRMAGRSAAEVAIEVRGVSETEVNVLRKVVAGWGFTPAIDTPGVPDVELVGSLVRRSAGLDAGVIVLMTCDNARFVVASKVGGVVLCVDHRAGHGGTNTPFPGWFSQLETGLERDGALAIMAIALAIERARSIHGPVVADVMGTASLMTPSGPVRIESGYNTAASLAVFSVTDQGFIPFRSTDPLGLSGIE
jgi:hypothetical protein